MTSSYDAQAANMRVLGVDPGATTGLSLIVNDEIVNEIETRSLLSIWGLLRIWKPNVIVIESFLGHRRWPVNVESPTKVIGICELYAECEGIRLEFSNPSKLQSKEKPRGLSPHIWSARTHALLYIERCK